MNKNEHRHSDESTRGARGAVPPQSSTNGRCDDTLRIGLTRCSVSREPHVQCEQKKSGALSENKVARIKGIDDGVELDERDTSGILCQVKA